MTTPYTPSLPDIAQTSLNQPNHTIDWVGMSKVHIPITLQDKNTTFEKVLSSVNIYVSLDSEEAKGIHMSRLYHHLNDFSNSQVLNPKSLENLLQELAKSQNGNSFNSFVSFDFELPIKRDSLLSKLSGWKSYPVKITADLTQGKVSYEIQLTVTYSSTCPCSAALARQLTAQKIQESFEGDSISKEELLTWLQSEEGSVATPHSQRSYAYLSLKLKEPEEFTVVNIIDEVEDSLQTAVQTIVKREDEQEFARLNGRNLMFCEDSLRRVKGTLEKKELISDYWIQIEHQESLHDHNAVAIDVKGIPHGYHPTPKD